MPDPRIEAAKYRFFSVAAIGTFMATLDGSILNIALPTIAARFECSVDQVAWVSLSYSLTLVALIMVYGAWTQRRGYGFAYKLGYVLFLAGSLACAFSRSVEMLIAARVLQATGTAVFSAIGPGLVSEVFPESERGKGLALTVMMVAAGFTIGPALGGLLLSVWNWQAIFLVNIPIGVVGFFLTARWFGVLDASRPSRQVHLLGAMALSVGLLASVLILSMLSNHAITETSMILLAVLAAAGLISFYVIESNPQKALIGFEIFRNRQFTISIASSLTMFISIAGVLILVPFYLEHVRGLAPKQVWTFLIILPVAMLVISPIAGRLSDKIGYRVLTSSGMFVLVIGLSLLSRLEAGSSDSYIFLSLVVIGIGMSLFSTPNSSALMGTVSPDQRAITSGIMATTRNMGMSIGVALSTALFAYFQSYYADIGNADELFSKSFEKVIFVAMAVAAMGIPLCILRANRVQRVTDQRL